MLSYGLLAWAICAQVLAQETTVRRSFFDYHPVTGQLTLERIDPGGKHCVETSYELDPYGNREETRVRYCGPDLPGAPGSAWFEERISSSGFPAQTVTIDGVAHVHSAGAYEGVTTGPLGHKEQRQYDVRFGAVAQTVAVATTPLPPSVVQNVVGIARYDGFGRRTIEARYDNDTAGAWTGTQYEYFYCSRTDGGTPAPGCWNFRETIGGVTYDSARLTTLAGGQEVVTNDLRVEAVSAYYVEATPVGNPGNNGVTAQTGAKTRVHYDALHRELGKETQNYDGRWVREFTAYDAIGLKGASYGPYFAAQPSDPPPADVRQWTVRRDLLHRALDQRVHVQGETTGTATGRPAIAASMLMTYNGLETSVTDPLGKRTVTRKNAAGQVAQTVDHLGATLNLTYDAVGQLRRTLDALGSITTVTYTAVTSRFKISITDPNTGTRSFAYDAVGQLISQTDARNQTTTITYDRVGRMLSRANPSQNDTWRYDTCANGLPRLCETFNDPSIGYRQLVTYDRTGRPRQTTNRLDGTDYVSLVTYDAFGRVSDQQYPTGLTVRNHYSTAAAGRLPGVLERIASTDGSRVFWRIDTLPAADVFDARGNLLRAQLGNGVQVFNQHDRATGKAVRLGAGASTASLGVQNSTYTYDLALNPQSRQDAVNGLTEFFNYDDLNRLTRYTVQSTSDPAANREVHLRYNAAGNLLWKSDVGVYLYPGGVNPVRPHAVTNAAGTDYQYDANGHLTTTTGAQVRVNDWTGFNQIRRSCLGASDAACTGGKSMTFVYDTGYKRVKNTVVDGATTRTLLMLHPDNAGGLSYEREITVSGATTRDESRHYLNVAGAVIGVIKTLNRSGVLPADAASTQYWHRDLLGSIVAVTDGSGIVVDRMAYDPWGRRITPPGRLQAGLNPQSTDRGFTGHEMLDELGLVHMNGRIYDPVLGRFLSPDPLIQAPTLLQNYNRYSYVLNRPLAGTDPNGEFWEIVVFIVGAILANEGNQYWRMVGQLMMMASLNGVPGEPGLLAQAGVTNSYASAFLSGSIATVAGGGSIESAMLAGVTAMGFNWAGGIGDKLSVERLLAHALVGCVQGAASGGECGPSAASAFAGKLMTGGAERFDLTGPAMAIATVVAGGTASVVGGGKFANGALTAGMGYVFNELLHSAAEARAKYAGNSRGHHWVPFGATTGVDISSEARAAWGLATNGEVLPRGVHTFHPEYTSAVRAELSAFAEARGIDLSKMTAAEANAFTQHIRTVDNPHIRPLVSRVDAYMQRINGFTAGQRIIYRAAVWMGIAAIAEQMISVNTAACQANPDCR